jgi:hypothetical protein
MAKTLENLLWCAGLATWLMILFAILGERLTPLSKRFGHLLEVALRLRAK